MSGAEHAPGYMISGFQAMVFVGVWVGVVVVYGLVRSLGSADPDPIRPPGPLD
jgi:hypothetical protein